MFVLFGLLLLEGAEALFGQDPEVIVMGHQEIHAWCFKTQLNLVLLWHEICSQGVLKLNFCFPIKTITQEPLEWILLWFMNLSY